jgi:hypothetical protein
MLQACGKKRSMASFSFRPMTKGLGRFFPFDVHGWCHLAYPFYCEDRLLKEEPSPGLDSRPFVVNNFHLADVSTTFSVKYKTLSNKYNNIYQDANLLWYSFPPEPPSSPLPAPKHLHLLKVLPSLPRRASNFCLPGSDFPSLAAWRNLVETPVFQSFLLSLSRLFLSLNVKCS